MKIAAREQPWLDTMEEAVGSLPTTESEFINQMMGVVDTTKFVARDYGLAG